MIEPMVMAGKRENHWVGDFIAGKVDSLPNGDIVWSDPTRLACISPEGVVKWARTYPSNFSMQEMFTSTDGDIYVAGTYVANYVALLKISSSGGYVWGKSNQAANRSSVGLSGAWQDSSRIVICSVYHSSNSSHAYAITSFNTGDGSIYRSEYTFTPSFGYRARIQSFESGSGQLVRLFASNSMTIATLAGAQEAALNYSGNSNNDFALGYKYESATGNNLVIAKLSGTNIVWQKVYRGFPYSIFNTIVRVESDGTLCVLSGTQIMKINATDGSVLWARSFGIGGGFGFSLANSGDYIISLNNKIVRLPWNGAKLGAHNGITYSVMNVTASNDSTISASASGTMPTRYAGSVTTSSLSAPTVLSLNITSLTRI